MAWSWGDGWDLYTAFADAYAGYWDSGAGTPTFVAGRFSGSQALHVTATATTITKSSGQNDAVHHLVVAFRQTAAISGTTLGLYLQLLDATTGQCCVVFRSDGAILLTSGTPGGTVLDTYTGAFPVTNTWYAFEFEIVINNATGRFRVRKNGNTSDDYDSTAIRNTRVSANNYANKLTIGMQAAVIAHEIDDTFWQSGAATGAFLSDLRCYTRMPASDSSVQFSRTPTGVLTQTVGSVGTTGIAGATAYFSAITAAYSGTVTGVGVAFSGLGTTVNMKCTIFADNGSNAPGAILASATPITPVVVGTNSFTFSGVSIVRGTQYWVGVAADGNGTFAVASSTTSTATNGASSYSAFPQANPVTTGNQRAVNLFWTYTATPANWQAVSEPQQDGTTSYVFDSNPGDADFYGVSIIPSTPVTTFAVTTRGYMQKSDAGTRTAAVQIKSGSTTVASPTLVLTTSGFLWAWRMDLTDPATSAAWTAAAVNNVTIGPTTIA